MRGRAAVALFALTSFAQPSSDYDAILRAYQTGDADAALAQLVNLDVLTVSDGAHALPQQHDARLLYAAAAIHTEAALLAHDDAGFLAGAYHLVLARDIVQYGELHVKPRRGGIDLTKSMLPTLRPSFRRVWYVASLRHLESWARFTEAEQLLERTRELYPRDAELLLLDAISDEAHASPRFASLTAGQRLNRLRDAERKLRGVLDIDPNAVEAQLRYGRVLQQLGYPADARRILTGLPASSDPRVRYLSSLFMGGLADQVGDVAGAAAWYGQAFQAIPAQSAIVARSELLHRGGDLDAAARELPEALEQSTQMDPWWTYPLGQFWLVDASRAQLRALARQ